MVSEPQAHWWNTLCLVYRFFCAKEYETEIFEIANFTEHVMESFDQMSK